jgi:hypothetical protein
MTIVLPMRFLYTNQIVSAKVSAAGPNMDHLSVCGLPLSVNDSGFPSLPLHRKVVGMMRQGGLGDF